METLLFGTKDYAGIVYLSGKKGNKISRHRKEQVGKSNASTEQSFVSGWGKGVPFPKSTGLKQPEQRIYLDIKI